VIVLNDDDGAAHDETKPPESNKGRAARPPHDDSNAHSKRIPRGTSGVTPTGAPHWREHPAIGYSPVQKPRDDQPGGSGEIINRTINDFMSQNSMLEKRIGELRSELTSQRKETEAAEAKVAELTVNAEAHMKHKADVLRKQGTLEKFVRTLGEDFNTLNTRNLDLNNRLKEALVEKAAIRTELEEARAFFLGELERLDRERTDFRGRAGALHSEITMLRNFHTFREAALGEKTGLLVEARDRVQTLEAMVQDLQRANVDERLKFDELKDLVIGANTNIIAKIEEGDGIKTER
jgi:chaperonin cofactor prefoldin